MANVLCLKSVPILSYRVFFMGKGIIIIKGWTRIFIVQPKKFYPERFKLKMNPLHFNYLNTYLFQ